MPHWHFEIVRSLSFALLKVWLDLLTSFKCQDLHMCDFPFFIYTKHINCTLLYLCIIKHIYRTLLYMCAKLHSPS